MHTEFAPPTILKLRININLEDVRGYMPTPDPVKDAIELSKRAALLLEHVSRLENQAREMRASGSTPAQVAKLNTKIVDMLSEANKALHQAKITVELARSDFKENDPSKLPILEKRFEHLSNLSAKMGRMQERVLSRLPPAPKTNPEMEMLKDAPKPSQVTPETEEKITQLVKNAFNEHGILKEKSLRSTLFNLSSSEKKLFVAELAKAIVNSGEHSQLSQLRALEQLSVLTHPEERRQFISAYKAENKARDLDILQSIDAPTTPLPTTSKRSQDDMLHSQPKAAAPEESKKAEFDKLVKDAVDGGFEQVKKVMASLPKEERLDFIVAAREEVANRKAQKAFESVKIPTDEPEKPSGPRKQ